MWRVTVTLSTLEQHNDGNTDSNKNCSLTRGGLKRQGKGCQKNGTRPKEAGLSNGNNTNIVDRREGKDFAVEAQMARKEALLHFQFVVLEQALVQHIQ